MADTTSQTAEGAGAEEDPWRLKTPPLSSEFRMHRDVRDGVEVGLAELEHKARGNRMRALPRS